MSKVQEKVTKRILNEETGRLDGIADFQFSFGSNHNMEDQLINLTEIIAAGFQRGASTGVIFLDIQRAFDRVWYAGLIAKMYIRGYDIRLLKLMQSYLGHRKFFVSLKEERLTIRQIAAGVPQGNVLGPQLYSIYTADIPCTNETKLALYADDTAVISTSLQREIET